jgi:catechol 2,3-dioxygenase-like lactoylglutathione lyase family enzyme
MEGAMRFLEQFDHFVVPVDDVLTAEDFYQDVFGCQVALNPHGKPMRIGLNVKEWKGGMRPHTFFDVAGKRIGVYLQTDERKRKNSVYGAPTCSFTTDERGLARVEAALKGRGTPYESDGEGEAPKSLRSLFFADPAGNNFQVYVPKGRSVAASPEGALSGVGYVRLEAPGLDRSVRFYTGIFGLEVMEIRQNKRLGVREAVLPLPNGQEMLLADTPFGSKGVTLTRMEAGPHLAFSVAPDRWEPLLLRLAEAGIEHGDRAADLKARRGDERDTYVDDPAGYVLQLVSDAA